MFVLGGGLFPVPGQTQPSSLKANTKPSSILSNQSPENIEKANLCRLNTPIFSSKTYYQCSQSVQVVAKQCNPILPEISESRGEVQRL